MDKVRFDITYLVTGASGFIGFHVAKSLLEAGANVVGFDNMNDYYAVSFKESRLKYLQKHTNFEFVLADLADKDSLDGVFGKYSPSVVIHLAAQAGVRYSLENPMEYIKSNVVGFVNILECCRHNKTKHLLYASSSSVYGANDKLPFSVDDRVDTPVSLYAATKKSNELLAYTYSHTFNLATTGMRFFTVYGPWGRPDMAPFLFLDAIEKGQPIKVFNNGAMMRDFTYIDDVVSSIISLVSVSAAVKTADVNAVPYKIYNIGNNTPEKLMDFINIMEECVGKTTKKIFMPMQPGDVPATFADIDDLVSDTGFAPTTNLREGLGKFVEWWRGYKTC
ncbi:MAG: GDP-mannose 4,6-dehydratase [Defluviitaleaceae bacterium]|nr:GDP-mannose 4,6-dehydratase [Defluviitaleaceae bacterium]